MCPAEASATVTGEWRTRAVWTGHQAGGCSEGRGRCRARPWVSLGVAAEHTNLRVMDAGDKGANEE